METHLERGERIRRERSYRIIRLGKSAAARRGGSYRIGLSGRHYQTETHPPSPGSKTRRPLPQGRGVTVQSSLKRRKALRLPPLPSGRGRPGFAGRVRGATFTTAL